MDREIRTTQAAGLEVRAADDGRRQIVGYAAVYNRQSDDLGGFVEEILPGAFDAVLTSGPDVRALIEHNPQLIIGRTRSQTLALGSDATGLSVVIIPPATSYAADLAESVTRGDVTQMSFAFAVAPGGDEWIKESDGRYRRTIRQVAALYDVSVVSYPAYPDTTVAMRSLTMCQQSRAGGSDPLILRRFLAVRDRFRQLRTREMGR